MRISFVCFGLLYIACIASACIRNHALRSKSDSCVGKCNQVGTDPSLPCQCNKYCEDFDDCCEDYDTVCKEDENTCKDRCDQTGVDSSKPCQCNPDCYKFGDCCNDFEELCGDQEVTDADLKEISTKLWNADVNRLPDDAYDVNIDGTKLFGFVNENYLSGPTYSSFIALLDNYEPDISQSEPDCPVCDQEVDTFVAATLETQVMKDAWSFLQDKGLASDDVDEFKAQIKQYWFTDYSRSKPKAGSTGFEHVFVGETKSSSVSGFHNWLQFYMEEKVGDLTYLGTNAQCKPDLLAVKMEWEGKEKTHASFMYGVSPEFELALFTICFAARSNENCPVQINGASGNIVTYYMSGVSPKTVGTAYFNC